MRRRHDTRDEWTHFERLHTLAFTAPIPMYADIDLTPLSGSLKIAGLLVRTSTGETKVLP